MKKSTQILKMYHDGTWRVLNQSGRRYCPFVVTREYYDAQEHRVRTKKVAEYSDLTSCLLFLTEVVNNGRRF